jgi:hypothetical protein
MRTVQNCYKSIKITIRLIRKALCGRGGSFAATEGCRGHRRALKRASARKLCPAKQAGEHAARLIFLENYYFKKQICATRASGKSGQ